MKFKLKDKRFMQNLATDTRARKRRSATALAIFAVLVASMLTAVGAFTMNRATAAPACVIPNDKIAVTVTDTTSGSNDNVSGWDWFKVDTKITNLDGTPEGCVGTVQLPPEFGGMKAAIIYLNADGTYTSAPQANTVASMEVDPARRMMIFTTTAYPSTHQNVAVNGYATAQIDDSVERGKTNPINVVINGEVEGTPITGKPCTTDCPTVPGQTDKWGTDNGDGTGSVTIQTPTVAEVGTKVLVEDTLTTSGQSILGLNWITGYTCVNTWGTPGVKQADGSCDTSQGIDPSYTKVDNGWEITSTVPGEFFRVNLKMSFTGPGPWKDTAKVTIDGKEYSAEATVARYEVGGGGSGNTIPTPTTTTTTTTTSTPPTTTSTPPTTTSTPPTSSTTTTSTTSTPPETSTTSTPPTTTSTTTPPTTPTSPTTGPPVITDGGPQGGSNGVAGWAMAGAVLAFIAAVGALARLKRNF